MDDPTRFMVTAKLDIRYRMPVPTETPLVAVGWAEEQNGRVSHARSQLQNIDGEVLAEAQLVLVDIPESRLPDADPEEVGWRVYPDEEEK